MMASWTGRRLAVLLHLLGMLTVRRGAAQRCDATTTTRLCGDASAAPPPPMVCLGALDCYATTCRALVLESDPEVVKEGLKCRKEFIISGGVLECDSSGERCKTPPDCQEVTDEGTACFLACNSEHCADSSSHWENGGCHQSCLDIW